MAFREVVVVVFVVVDILDIGLMAIIAGDVIGVVVVDFGEVIAVVAVGTKE
jgi:hypothetical protein